ncbi:hypothetical protein J4Q44_G00333880 [Coregonus suidteri]|uniref:Uncharacterized protein n=1 Tax=Coregonus suidteri TaxID=861788 RepID=A0AAN8L1A6_9TELE
MRFCRREEHKTRAVCVSVTRVVAPAIIWLSLPQTHHHHLSMKTEDQLSSKNRPLQSLSSNALEHPNHLSSAKNTLSQSQIIFGFL